MRTQILHIAALGVLLLGSARGLAQTGGPQNPGSPSIPDWYAVGCNGGGVEIPFASSADYRYDSAVITYTVGESCIAFDHQHDFDITEGFQQPDGYGIKPYDPFNAIEQIIFYPNPCHQFANVSFYLNESFTNLSLKVFDLNGRCAYKDEFTSGDGLLKYDLQTSRLSPGMYIVEIVGFTNKRYVGKLIIIP